MIDIVNQLPLHVTGAIILECLLNGIAEPLLRLDRVDGSIAALQVDALVLVELLGIAVAVDIAVAGVAAKQIASASDHDCVR